MNPNTEYERFPQYVYQQLVNMDVARKTKVHHDEKLEGRSGQKHQIDVYWEYEIAKKSTESPLNAKTITGLFQNKQFAHSREY